eukprot:3130861-Amphidinium_carterae.1
MSFVSVEALAATSLDTLCRFAPKQKSRPVFVIRFLNAQHAMRTIRQFLSVFSEVRRWSKLGALGSVSELDESRR